MTTISGNSVFESEQQGPDNEMVGVDELFIT